MNTKQVYWDILITDATRRVLYNAASAYRRKFLSSGISTYWPTNPKKIPDLVDLFIKNVSMNYTNVEDVTYDK